MGREEHCKQRSLACVRSARSVSATLGLPPLTACVLSLSALLRLQVALQGNNLKQALGCVHFPGLRYSGSGSQVLHKGAHSVGHSSTQPSIVSNQWVEMYKSSTQLVLQVVMQTSKMRSILQLWMFNSEDTYRERLIVESKKVHDLKHNISVPCSFTSK